MLKYITLSVGVLIVGCTKTTDDSDSELVGNWVRKWDFEARARTEAVATVADNGKVFLGLGFDGTNRLVDFWEYSSANDVWYQRADFPGTPRNSAIAFSLQDKIYIGLGYDGVNYLNDMWKYDPLTDGWEMVESFPGTGRSGAVSFVINNMAYVAAGYDGNYLKDFWQYDGINNVWTKKTSPPGFKRNDAVAFVIGSKAFLCTGVNNGEYVNDLNVYDAVTESWETRRNITNTDSDLDYDDDYTTITRSNGVAFTLNGKGYVATGISGSYRRNTWEYDPDTDLWTEKTAFEGTAREGSVAFVVDNRVFVGLGNSSNLRFDNFYEFLPTAEYEEND